MQHALRLGEYPPEQGVSQQRPHLILNWGYRVRTVAEGIAVVLAAPEISHLDIGELPGHRLAERGIDEQPQNIRQRRIPDLEERKERIAEHVLHPHAPRVMPVLLEGFKEPRGRKRNLVRMNAPEGVVAEGLRGVGSVEVVKIALTLFGNHGSHPLDEVSVRIDERDTTSGLNVLPD